MEEVKEFVQLTIDDYMRYKTKLMQELNNLANGFICAGYYLKKIRDSEAYRNDGYENIYEFAQKEYGITRTVASRFMSINDRFSKDGYSLELMEQYKGLGSSRLTEMLTLDMADHEMITNVTRIEDIRELKRFEKQEPEATATAYCELYWDFFREKEKEFNAVMQMENIRDVAEIVNPSGNKTWKYRMLFMAMKEYDKGISIKDLIKPAPETITWEQFVEQCRSIFVYDYEAAGTPYEQNYRNSESKEPEKAGLKETEDKNSATLKENMGPGDPGKEKNKNIVSAPEKNKEIVNERAEDEKEEDKEESKAAGTDKPTEVQSEEKTEVVEGEVENGVCDIAQDEKSNESESIKYLKVREQYIDDIKSGKKRFTIRRNDKDYEVGQIYTLRIVRMVGNVETYLTDYSIRIRITYILDDFEGLATGYIAMGYEVLG